MTLPEMLTRRNGVVHENRRGSRGSSQQALLATAWRGGASAGCDGFVQGNRHVCRSATILFPDVVVGTPFTGYYTYNLATPEYERPCLSVGDYHHSSAPYGVTVTIGSRTFKTNPANVNFLVELVNDYYNQDNFNSSTATTMWTVDGIPVQIHQLAARRLHPDGVDETSTCRPTPLNLSQLDAVRRLRHHRDDGYLRRT